MAIERMVYECSKVGIEKNYSGGQIYSYTKGMKTLLADPELNISRLADYKEPVDFEPDPEKNIAPMSFTYRQLDTLFPKQFRYIPYPYGMKRLFAFSNNKLSVDWDQYEDYEAYLSVRKNADAFVGGRSGSHEFYILAGDLTDLGGFPCMYYQSESLKVPYTPKDFCSSIKPDYMTPLQSLYPGDGITKESVSAFLAEDRDRIGILKKMAYCLLRYQTEGDGGYGKNLVICDDHETVIYWIAALSFLFSPELAKEISFSTYEYSPMGAGYRICGAFPKGTDYEPGVSYRESYVFDLLNQEFEETDHREDQEFYGFLVNSFLYAPDKLEHFYAFVAKFDYSEVSVELENAYELYRLLYLNADTEQMDAARIRLAGDFAKHCADDMETRKILVNFVNLYMGKKYQSGMEIEDTLLTLLKHFSGHLGYLQQLCVSKIVDLLMPASGVNIEVIRKMYVEYDIMFSKAGASLFPVYYEILQSRAQSILRNNQNLQYNMYIAEVICRHIKENNMDVSCIMPNYAEGKMLHTIVENIIRIDPANSQMEDCIIRLTKPFMENAYDYLYLIMGLEGMAQDCSGNAVSNWTMLSEKQIGQFIDSRSGSYVFEMYEALMELDCEHEIVKHLEHRSRSEESFGFLFEDSCRLLSGYGKRFKGKERYIYKIMLDAAINKENVQNNLVMILKMERDENNDGVILEAAEQYIDRMGMGIHSIDVSLLKDLIGLYEERNMEPSGKLQAVKVLKELETELQKGKKTILSRCEKLPAVPEEQMEFPKVTESMGRQFLNDFGAKIIELYAIGEQIQAVHYYNHLFRLKKTEISALMEMELKALAGEYRKAEGAFCKLLAYSLSLGYQPEPAAAAEILSANKVNANRMNKYFSENNKELLKELSVRLKIREAQEPAFRKELLAYWNDIYNMANERESNFMKKVMRNFLKK